MWPAGSSRIAHQCWTTGRAWARCRPTPGQDHRHRHHRGRHAHRVAVLARAVPGLLLVDPGGRRVHHGHRDRGAPAPGCRPARPGVRDTSFPSGHAAAAAAYSAIAIVIFERTRNRWAHTFTVLVAVGLPVIVGICRMYRGVHYLTDVIAGIPLGVACVVAVYVVVRRCFQRPGSDRHRSTPGQSPRPDPR
jgi:membrane-associated phospholipid phosphatase